ncbi:TetR/AcrR family transcriptional regulator [Gaiella sp.]|uniref:TetR/AcrR family transcriptional regulator n=1 Tax=Gaiella sp. TaxID=2663207 RepID=UPI002C01E58C|nr:TetR/AcrR family transcriptional regulator [Gaiella sp.]HWO81281.1 TetR/AcrR family transcriptional regulator [Gaiella sp.]
MPTPETTAPTLRRDARENRNRILAAARAAFAAEGVDVPVEAIADRAGVGMGTLYRRFPTKHDLVQAVIEESLDAFVVAAEEGLAEDDPWTGFTGFVERVLELHVENRALREVLAGTEHGHARDAVRRRVRPLVRRLIERAHADGSLRPDFAPEDMPLVFMTAGRVLEAGRGVAPDLWRRYLGLLLDGLRAGGATPLPRGPLTQAQMNRLLEGERR